MIFTDFESYYAPDYTLAKVGIRDYVTDSRFQTIGVGIQLGLDSTPRWYAGSDADTELARLKDQYPNEPWCAHNMRFDGAILKWRYGIEPTFYYDTRLMANPRVVPHTGSASLAACADYFSLPPKGVEVIQAKGKRLEDFSDRELDQYGKYCKHDVWLMVEIFKRLIRRFPERELRLIDLSLRKYLCPVLQLDPLVLQTAVESEQARRARAIKEGGLPLKILNSRPQFAQYCATKGIELPLKVSPTTGKRTLAMAATDTDFTTLQYHPVIGPQVKARLAVSSNIELRRAERLLELSKKYPDLSVPLTYYGAHTGRYTGDEKINLQNLPAQSPLRHAIRAPEGHKIVAIDYSQIELRLSAWWGAEYGLLETLRAGHSPYIEIAQGIFGRPVSKKDTPKEYKVGKFAMLSLQYYTGILRFSRMLMAQGISEYEATRCASDAVALYRTKYQGIVRGWYRMGRIVRHLCGHAYCLHMSEPCGVDQFIQQWDVGRGAASLPNGMELIYPSIVVEPATTGAQYTCTFGNKQKRIHGGVLTENWIQALARIITFDSMLDLDEFFPAVMQAHDENVFVVPNENVDEFVTYAKHKMRQPPDWAPSLPLDVEIAVGDTYGECK